MFLTMPNKRKRANSTMMKTIELFFSRNKLSLPVIKPIKNLAKKKSTGIIAITIKALYAKAVCTSP